jgi:hypothetical protein
VEEMACIAEALRWPLVVVGVEAAGGGIREIAGLSPVLATGALGGCYHELVQLKVFRLWFGLSGLFVCFDSNFITRLVHSDLSMKPPSTIPAVVLSAASRASTAAPHGPSGPSHAC